jgi:phosphoribosylformylglycinamidine cyclo-ligase
LAVNHIGLETDFEGESLGKVLLEPTRIYVKSLLALQQQVEIHALAHITGGGLLENIPRVLPERVSAILEVSSWERPPIFNWLQQHGNITDAEMYRTFNCGVGMVVCVAATEADNAMKILQNLGETVWKIGEVQFYQDSNVVIV